MPFWAECKPSPHGSFTFYLLEDLAPSFWNRRLRDGSLAGAGKQANASAAGKHRDSVSSYANSYFFWSSGISGFDPPTNSFLPSLNVMLLPLARLVPFLA